MWSDSLAGSFDCYVGYGIKLTTQECDLFVGPISKSQRVTCQQATDREMTILGWGVPPSVNPKDRTRPRLLLLEFIIDRLKWPGMIGLAGIISGHLHVGSRAVHWVGPGAFPMSFPKNFNEEGSPITLTRTPLYITCMRSRQWHAFHWYPLLI